MLITFTLLFSSWGKYKPGSFLVLVKVTSVGYTEFSFLICTLPIEISSHILWCVWLCKHHILATTCEACINFMTWFSLYTGFHEETCLFLNFIMLSSNILHRFLSTCNSVFGCHMAMRTTWIHTKIFCPFASVLQTDLNTGFIILELKTLDINMQCTYNRFSSAVNKQIKLIT
jgi:hypothetical protein